MAAPAFAWFGVYGLRQIETLLTGDVVTTCGPSRYYLSNEAWLASGFVLVPIVLLSLRLRRHSALSSRLRILVELTMTAWMTGLGTSWAAAELFESALQLVGLR